MMQLLRHQMLQVVFPAKEQSTHFLEETNQTKNWLMRVPGLLELTLYCTLKIIIVL